MKRIEDESQLKTACEQAYAIRLVEFVDIDKGGSSRNFRARAAGGTDPFFIKVVPSLALAQLIAARLDKMKDFNAVKGMFGGRPFAFGELGVVALSLCPGTEVLLSDYTSRRVESVLSFHRALLKVIQNDREAESSFDLVKLYTRIRDAATRCGDHWLLPYLESVVSDDLRYNPARCCVTQGDFHPLNFHFTDETVAGIFDVMEFRVGYPTDDFVRLAFCSADRLRWYARWKMGRLRRHFRALVAGAGGSVEDWRVSVNCHILRKLWKYYTKGRAMGFFMRLKWKSLFKLYRLLEEDISAALAQTPLGDFSSERPSTKVGSGF